MASKSNLFDSLIKEQSKGKSYPVRPGMPAFMNSLNKFVTAKSAAKTDSALERQKFNEKGALEASKQNMIGQREQTKQDVIAKQKKMEMVARILSKQMSGKKAPLDAPMDIQRLLTAGAVPKGYEGLSDEQVEERRAQEAEEHGYEPYQETVKGSKGFFGLGATPDKSKTYYKRKKQEAQQEMTPDQIIKILSQVD